MAIVPEVICVGAALVDIPLRPVSKAIFQTESYPVEQIRMTVGGDALNEAAILTRLGHQAGLLSMVGEDPAGDFILRFCRENHIATKGIAVESQVDTSINIGLVTDDGERTFITNRNGSLWKLEIHHIQMENFEGARLLSLASFFNAPKLDQAALLPLFTKAKEMKMVICADMIHPRLGETLADIESALSLVDYFFPNYEEARLLTGKNSLPEIAQVFLNTGLGHVLIKIGNQGCYFQDRQEAFTLPAYPDIQAVDTIGAGDNFAAGFLSGLLEGRSHWECALLGNTVASISVQYPGATTGVQNRKQVDNWLANYRQKLENRQEAAP